MSRRFATVLLASVCVALVALGLWWGLRGDGAAPPTVAAAPSDATEEQTEEITLYFPGAGGRLYAETRSIPVVVEVEARVVRVVEEVLSGPSTPELEAPLPAGTTLRGIDLLGERVAFVDLGSEEELPPAGSRREMLIVYSLVDSVVANVKAIERVGLLWNGIQRSTLAGHIDLTHPLPADMDLVANRR
jgi:hypothetical protein